MRNINIGGRIVRNAALRDYTSFRIGGPADILAEPATPEDIAALLELTDRFNIPRFVLGGGANILVSDKGIRGLVIRLAGLNYIRTNGTRVSAGAGCAMSEVAGAAGKTGMTGLEFIYSMPGSVGGSVWMNARCYNRSVSEVLGTVSYMTKEGRANLEVGGRDFGYKVSPFQSMDAVILEAEFVLKEGKAEDIERAQEEVKKERTEKGHFLFPSAGSVFKNNRAFGESTGKIIESLGLKGMRIGGAQIAEFHGNIIVNRGGATAGDVRGLIELVEERARRVYGFSLEREVLLVGEW